MHSRYIKILKQNKKATILVVLAMLVIITGVSGIIITSSSSSTGVAPTERLTHQQFEAESYALASILSSSGLEESFGYARDKVQSDPSFARDCHPLMHHLGHQAFAKFGEFAVTMEMSDEICNSGFVHGLIEAYFKNIEDIKKALKTTCSEDGRENFKQWQCFHGVGHGIMYTTGKNLPQSLELCKSLASSFAQDSCINGVFMERFIVVNHNGEHPKHTELADIELCKTQEDRHKSYCYTYAPTTYLELNPNNYSGAFKQCGQSEQEFRLTCISGVGAQSIKDNITSPSFTANLCSDLSSRNYQLYCIAGAVGLFIYHHGGLESATQLCSTEFQDFKQTCSEVVSSKRYLFDN